MGAGDEERSGGKEPRRRRGGPGRKDGKKGERARTRGWEGGTSELQQPIERVSWGGYNGERVVVKEYGIAPHTGLNPLLAYRGGALVQEERTHTTFVWYAPWAD